MNGRGIVTLGLCLSLLTASPAVTWAQQPSSFNRGEFGLAATLLGPFALGSASADLIRPSGGRLSLFNTTDSLGPGPGLEASLAFRISRRFALQAAGNWSVTTVRATIEDDFEGVPDVTISESLSRFGAIGAALWTFRDRHRASWFLRAGAGWMREVAGAGASAQDGIVGNAGGGVKYWFGNQPRPRGRRVGLSLEALALLRSGGISRGSHAVRVAPALQAGLVTDF